ncbi:MAG: dUTP diphosphatase, partial [Gammaproteobacteria bacterium]|nr:dUTP diphosphatase [Gammaproteobacteria bacterium]
NATPEERMNAIRDKSLALYQEVAELVDSFPWKPWRSIEDQPWSNSNAIEEIVDCFFFLGEIMEAADIDPENLSIVFNEKLAENYDRIKRGYNNDPSERR